MEAQRSLRISDEIAAEKATEPRVTLKYIESRIARQIYFTVGEAARKLDIPADPLGEDRMDVLTICILTLDNGYTEVGHSSPVSDGNFDSIKGQRFAYESAVRKLWPMFGFAMREGLASAPETT